MLRDYPAPAPGAPALLLAHGAGAGHDHPWIVRAAQGLARRGVRVLTFDFPYTAAGRRVPDPAPVLETALADAWTGAGAVFAGGKSMGGRIASMAAAAGRLEPPPAGLVFFGYPLHPPGRPAQRRDRHLPAIGAPLLFLHGTRDGFGTPDEMTALAGTLGTRATLYLVEGGDHSLLRPRRADPEGRALDEALDAAAAWMLAIAGTGRSGGQATRGERVEGRCVARDHRRAASQRPAADRNSSVHSWAPR